jgi:hypothetical protein
VKAAVRKATAMMATIRMTKNLSLTHSLLFFTLFSSCQYGSPSTFKQKESGPALGGRSQLRHTEADSSQVAQERQFNQHPASGEALRLGCWPRLNCLTVQWEMTATTASSFRAISLAGVDDGEGFLQGVSSAIARHHRDR